MRIPSREIIKVLSIVAVFVAILLVVYMIRLQLIWLGTAFFLSIALNPLVLRLTRVMPRRSRALATGTVFLGVAAVFLLLIVVLTPPVVKQTEQLNIGPILLIVYSLLFLYGIGFLFIRSGARKLTHIEAAQ